MKRMPPIECDDSQLCHELMGKRDDVAFHYLYRNDPPTRVVDESENFALIVDISPVVEGHCLLVPKGHYLSFGHIPEYLHRELQDFESRAIRRVAREYGEPAILEHGSASTMKNSPCISHAHWHIVPGAQKAYDVFEQDGLARADLVSWRDLGAFAEEDRAYVYYKSGDRAMAYYTENLSKRHQYMRVVVAEIFEIPEPEWDWAICLHPERLRRTFVRLTHDIG